MVLNFVLLLIFMVITPAMANVDSTNKVFKNTMKKSVLSSKLTKSKQPRYLFGIDVSHYQGHINWLDVEEASVHYAMVKATGGITYVDPLFNRNWRHLSKVKIIRGAYHFFYAGDDPIAQANNYFQVVGRLSSQDLPPIVDVELLDSVSADVLLSRLIRYLNEIEKLTRRTPIIYTNQYFGQQYLRDKRFKKYTLWIAEYGVRLTDLPAPWRTKSWNFWQYSQHGKVSGISPNVDLNHFQGSYKQLQLFIEQSAH